MLPGLAGPVFHVEAGKIGSSTGRSELLRCLLKCRLRPTSLQLGRATPILMWARYRLMEIRWVRRGLMRIRPVFLLSHLNGWLSLGGGRRSRIWEKAIKQRIREIQGYMRDRQRGIRYVADVVIDEIMSMPMHSVPFERCMLRIT